MRMSRAKVLGGCSSHNGCVSLHTFKDDCERFQQHGCTDWSFETIKRMIRRSRLTYQVVDKTRQNTLVTDWITTCSTAFDVPVIEDVDKEISMHGDVVGGTGYMPISYDVSSGKRNSASTSYIHPLLRGERHLPNLKILTNAWVSKIIVKNDKVEGVTLLQGDKELHLLHKKETILCAGTIDTPRLMLLSGLGPKDNLIENSIPVVKDIPGVGENLQDHVETNLVWALRKPVPPETVTYSDSFLFYRRQNNTSREVAADIMFHLYTTPDLPNFEPLGYETPRHPLVIMPNIPRPRSRGRLYLVSSDPKVQPELDFRYFTDAEGYDERVLVDGIKMARKLAKTEPLSQWISHEVAPGPQVSTDEELSTFGRKMSTTLFHPLGTTTMGDLQKNPMAVVDRQYKVRSLTGLRIADAGVIPVMTTTNPMLTVIAIAEHAAEVIAQSYGYQPEDRLSTRL